MESRNEPQQMHQNENITLILSHHSADNIAGVDEFYEVGPIKQLKAMMERTSCQHHLAMSFALVMLQPGSVRTRVLPCLFLPRSVSPVATRIVVRLPVDSDHYRSAAWPLQVKEVHEPSALGAEVQQPVQPACQQVQSLRDSGIPSSLASCLNICCYRWCKQRSRAMGSPAPLNFVTHHKLDMHD